MRIITVIAYTTAIILIVGGTHVPAAVDSGGEVIYARGYSGGRRLVVLKNEVPLKEVYPNGMPETEPSPRNPAMVAQVIYPEHVYEYSFIVKSGDGKSKAVAKAGCGTLRGEVERMKFEIYDVALYEDELVVLVRSGRVVLADVALLGRKRDWFPDARSPMARQRHLGERELGRLGGGLNGRQKPVM